MKTKVKMDKINNCISHSYAKFTGSKTWMQPTNMEWYTQFPTATSLYLSYAEEKTRTAKFLFNPSNGLLPSFTHVDLRGSGVDADTIDMYRAAYASGMISSHSGNRKMK
jgi:hypothetical protein